MPPRPPRPNFRMTLHGLRYLIEKNWCLASYLIINFDIGEIAKLAERELPESFSGEMAKHVYGYIYENKLPPAEIATTVLNVAEDLMAGKEVQLRAGDYIAVQKFMMGKR
jgi:hypothetical protein